MNRICKGGRTSLSVLHFIPIKHIMTRLQMKDLLYTQFTNSRKGGCLIVSSSETILFQNIFSMSGKEINRNFEYLGEGAGRIIYAIDDNYVIKLSKFHGGYLQCETENFIYDDVDENLKRYLCPVVWYQEDMLIMRRAIPFARRREDKHKNVFKLLGVSKNDILYKNIMDIVDSYDLLYGDIKSLSSWGILDNKILLIDYGCTNKIYKKYFSKD